MTQLQSGIGMRGGPENPIGARGLYLWQGNKDTLYRIHGTNEPWTIGQNVSSGCIRLTNDDITTQYFAKLKSLLRPAGRLVIVDFKADSPNGPPVRHRISPERVTQELKAAGYALVDTL